MTSLTNADFDRVRAEAQAVVDEYHLPGIGIGIVAGDDLVFAEGFGFADIESGKKQAPELRQRIGSITKTMIALSTMALVDEGKLSLEDRLVDHIPEVKFHGPGDQIRIRHMLTHTTGIGEAPLPSQIRDINPTLWSEEPFAPPIEEAYPEGITVEVEPGAKWAYANHAFTLLGEIVMRAEDAGSVDEVLRKRIFEPLGMANTDCHDLPHDGLTTGYHTAPPQDAIELAKQAGAEVPAAEGEPVDGFNHRGRYQYVKGRAAGAVQSTIPDMAKYASALLKKSAGIVKPETFDQMTSPQWCPDERLQSIGYAFFRERRFGRFTFEHGGGVAGGWGTGMWIFPQENVALLTHCNINSEQLGSAASRIMRALFNEPASHPEPVEGWSVDDDLLEQAPGVYQAPMPGPLTNLRIITGTGRIQISLLDGGLELHARRGPWKDGARMLPDEHDLGFFTLDTNAIEPPRVALVRDASGAVTGLRFDRLIEMERTNDDLAWV